VIACVVRRDASFLICQRPAHKRHGGLWEFPGGKVEAGEPDSETARRELREELNLQLLSARAPIVELVDPGSRFVIAFLPVIVIGEPECLEHTSTSWRAPADLLELPLAPSDRVFVQYVLTLPPGTLDGVFSG
jgi:8-oxo-dGTP pyrophosphatase MutT (NUDIX family)